MCAFLRLFAVIGATAALLMVFTRYREGTWQSQAELWGYPVVSIAQTGARGWLALGQVDARGGLVVAQVGFGLVALAQAGSGLFLGVGQVQASLVTFCQVGFGLFFFLGQLGVGAQARGQLVFRRRSKRFFAEMSEEFSELLSFRGPPPRTTIGRGSRPHWPTGKGVAR